MGKRNTNPIRKRRLDAGLTQEELAANLRPQVSSQTVRFWEWGNWSPSGGNLVALAKLFKVTTKTIRSEYEEWKNEPNDEEEAGS